MPTGYVISDLHLFSRRSSFEWWREEVEAAAERADVFVLNGDVFDFRWTTLPSVAATADAAIDWLARFASRNPRCRFHFVMGNHDHVRPFLERLPELAAHAPNLAVHEHYLLLGDRLFLHGDAAAADPSADGLRRYRARHLDEEKRGGTLARLYDLAVFLRLHSALSRFHMRQDVCRRLLAYLAAVAPELTGRFAHVYFGHLHVPFMGYVYEGVVFHNTGAAIKGHSGRLLEFPVEEGVCG